MSSSKKQTVPLHYETFGSGQPVVLLHGLFGSLSDWGGVSQVLAESFQVFVVDQRNHGASPHSSLFDYPALARDLEAFMDEQGLASAILIGHSMGGKTAMEFALSHPERVDCLVVVDIAPRAYAPFHVDIVEALLSVDPQKFASRTEVGEALKPKIPKEPVRQFLLKNIIRSPEGKLNWRLNLKGIQENYSHIIEELNPGRQFVKPTLFVRGGKSEYIREKDLALIRQYFPLAKVVTFPQTGHWVIAENPQDFLKTVLPFVEK